MIGTRRVQSPGAVGRILRGVLGLVLVAIIGPRQAEGTPTILAPEETRVLEVADGATCELVIPPQRMGGTGAACVNQSPTPSCVADAAARTLKVDAGLGTFRCAIGSSGGIDFPGGPIRSAAGIGRLINAIAIEAPATQPAALSFPVQISTEVQWDGILFPLPFVLPVQSQVIATLQVRDTTTGEVVASNTFFFERSGPTRLGDSLSDLPCGFLGCNSNPFDFLVALNNGTGVDLIAELLRDREYAIEVEAKCEHTGNYSHPDPGVGLGVVVAIAGGCFFGGEQNEIFNGWAGVFADSLYDGFSVGPITVTVGTDLTAKLNLCPNSDRSPTVVIDGCDSGVTNARLDDGCTMADEIAACAAEAARHGGFVSCVAALTNVWKSDGLVSGREKGAIQRCAARADLP